jgi:cell division protein ZapA
MADNTQGRKTDFVTVEIYDQLYHLSGQNAEHIRSLAKMVDSKMRAVAAHGRTVDSLRVAVLAALNLADELAQKSAPRPQAATRLVPSRPKPPQAEQRIGRARAASLRGLLDEVLAEPELKTGS